MEAKQPFDRYLLYATAGTAIGFVVLVALRLQPDGSIIAFLDEHDWISNTFLGLAALFVSLGSLRISGQAASAADRSANETAKMAQIAIDQTGVAKEQATFLRQQVQADVYPALVFEHESDEALVLSNLGRHSVFIHSVQCTDPGVNFTVGEMKYITSPPTFGSAAIQVLSQTPSTLVENRILQPGETRAVISDRLLPDDEVIQLTTLFYYGPNKGNPWALGVDIRRVGKHYQVREYRLLAPIGSGL